MLSEPERETGKAVDAVRTKLDYAEAQLDLELFKYEMYFLYKSRLIC